MSLTPSFPSFPRSIAIVSGKGGSGKTVIAAVMTEVFDNQGVPVILVDADTGTAGLSFYLGLELVSNTAVGLTNLISLDNFADAPPIRSLLQTIKGLKSARFLSAGDYRRFPQAIPRDVISTKFQQILDLLKSESGIVIIDCRGGIDTESMAVCKAVDDIIVIVETDTTSYQASQQLVEILNANGVAMKLRGFIINKVFDDPKTLARNGTAAFHSKYLGSIPFDFETMRDFFIGKVPDENSVFAAHVQYALSRAYSDMVREPYRRIYRFEDYREIGLVNLDSMRGGVIISFVATVFAAVLVLAMYFGALNKQDLMVGTGLLWTWALLGSIEASRKSVGKVFNRFFSILFFRGADRK